MNHFIDLPTDIIVLILDINIIYKLRNLSSTMKMFVDINIKQLLIDKIKYKFILNSTCVFELYRMYKLVTDRYFAPLISHYDAKYDHVNSVKYYNDSMVLTFNNQCHRLEMRNGNYYILPILKSRYKIYIHG